MKNYEAVKQCILDRKTVKVLQDVEDAQEIDSGLEQGYQELVREMLEVAGFAPFHFPRNVGSMTEPWRAHVLWNAETNDAARYMVENLGIKTKEPKLAAASQALVLITWLPEYYTSEQKSASRINEEAQRIRDEEHLAATSAMVQSFLLLLTSKGIGNYWSSGGCLRGKEMFEYCGVSSDERLLAAVFIEYPECMDSGKERKSGALRETRSKAWIQEKNS